jgi:glucosamine--fructose-6-phosphate aminotransferase (isomerizing)
MAVICFMALSTCGTSLNAAKYDERLMKHFGSFHHINSINVAKVEAKNFSTCIPKELGVLIDL